MGDDNVVRVPFSVVAFALLSLAGGIVGYLLSANVGMWIGMVAGGASALGTAVLIGRRG